MKFVIKTKLDREDVFIQWNYEFGSERRIYYFVNFTIYCVKITYKTLYFIHYDERIYIPFLERIYIPYTISYKN